MTLDHLIARAEAGWRSKPPLQRQSDSLSALVVLLRLRRAWEDVSEAYDRGEATEDELDLATVALGRAAAMLRLEEQRRRAWAACESPWQGSEPCGECEECEHAAGLEELRRQRLRSPLPVETALRLGLEVAARRSAHASE